MRRIELGDGHLTLDNKTYSVVQEWIMEGSLWENISDAISSHVSSQSKEKTLISLEESNKEIYDAVQDVKNLVSNLKSLGISTSPENENIKTVKEKPKEKSFIEEPVSAPIDFSIGGIFSNLDGISDLGRS